MKWAIDPPIGLSAQQAPLRQSFDASVGFMKAEETLTIALSKATSKDAVNRAALMTLDINFFCKICKILAGSFSAVSRRNFARKHAFDSMFLKLYKICILLHRCNLKILAKSV